MPDGNHTQLQANQAVAAKLRLCRRRPSSRSVVKNATLRSKNPHPSASSGQALSRKSAREMEHPGAETGSRRLAVPSCPWAPRWLKLFFMLCGLISKVVSRGIHEHFPFYRYIFVDAGVSFQRNLSARQRVRAPEARANSRHCGCRESSCFKFSCFKFSSFNSSSRHSAADFCRMADAGNRRHQQRSGGGRSYQRRCSQRI